jgi:membrane-associated protease RseP (regulator of RpoE activity)
MSVPEPGGVVFLEGNSLLYLLLKFAVFGKILPGSGLPLTFPAAAKEIAAALFGTSPLAGGYDVMIHPVALAGWAGLLVTALNLLPVGQLDGGHVMYSLLGQRAKVFTWPIIIVAVIMGFFLWPGWFLWAGLIFLLGRQHPDPLDHVTRLGTLQKIYAALVLVIFLLVFTPVPLQLISAEPLAPEIGQAANCLGLPALVLGIILWSFRKRRDRRYSKDPSRRQSD